MSVRNELVTLGVGMAIGLGAVPAYKYFSPEVAPTPVFAQAKPVLVSADEIAAVVRSDAFLVSSRTNATAQVVVRSGSDISSDAPTDGWWAWVREWWNYKTTRDRLTTEVSGDVLAGFDLRDISAKNVTYTDKEVILNLGAPEFLGVLNDEMATKFVKRETGWFRVKDETLFLASQALGEPALQAAACRNGALQTAGKSGVEIMARITNLLRARGDHRMVRVIFTPRPC